MIQRLIDRKHLPSPHNKIIEGRRPRAPRCLPVYAYMNLIGSYPVILTRVGDPIASLSESVEFLRVVIRHLHTDQCSASSVNT